MKIKETLRRCSRRRVEKPMTLDVKPWYGYDTMIREKVQAQRLSAIYYRAGVEVTQGYTRRGQRVAMCGDMLGVQAGRVVVQWHCDDRLCPLCAAKNARRVAANARVVLERAQHEAMLKPYLLTLTQRNCRENELADRVSDMLKSWDSITHGLRKNRRFLQGYARTIEITVNYHDGSYHPHLHSIMLLSPDAPREMLRARYWAALWAKYMDTKRYQDIIPVCDIRPIRPNKRKHLTSTSAAAAEVAKYTAKSGSILSHAGAYERILAIDQAISGRRLRSYGGVWRTIRAQMRLEDAISASEPDARYLADAPIEIWAWAGMEKRVYTRIV